MKSNIPLIAAAALLCLSSLSACGGGLDDDVDCTDECDDPCDEAPKFDFENYEGSCPALSESPEFCGVSSSDDCIEPDFDIEETTIAEIHDALEAGEISCQWLTRKHIDRALWHDLYMEDGAPPMNTFVYLNDGAMETARRLDEYQQCEQELTGALHCVPFVPKTNYASKEVPLTNGSFALDGTQPNSDSFAVDRLRRAGAVMLGTTAMDEFAAGAQGLSGRSGKTGNAYDTTRNSGGSSAGSSVAVAASMAVGGLGTDNCSSLTVPASYNSLFTMRSSHQLVSTDGIFPSNRLDAIAGPLTRTAEDLALFFTEMAAFNPHYGPHCRHSIPTGQDYTKALDPDGLQGKRIGVLREFGDGEDDTRRPYEGGSAEVLGHFEDFFDELRDAGAVVIDDIEIDGLPLNRSGSGSGYDGDRFLEDTTGGPADYEAVCETEMYSRYVFADKDACMNRAKQSARNLESRLESGLERYADNRAYVESVLDDHDLDAFVYPADRRGPPRAYYTGTTCVLASVTGLPTVVMPTGFTDGGLPIGMSFTGRMFDDALLIEMAYGYEQSTWHRQPPQLPDLDGEPPMTIEEFNDLHYDVGWASFEQIFRDSSDKSDMTASVFADIAREVLQDWGLEELLD